MHIQINTDHNIHGSDALAAEMEAIIESTLGRFDTQITRIETHLSDENSSKGGSDDKRCVMEARLEGRRPIASSHEAADLELAVRGAAGKLKTMIESELGKLAAR